MINELIKFHLSALTEVKSKYKRYLYQQINWQNRLIAIMGARGVGKTTLMLQFYQENFSSPEECLYLSCDNIKVIHYGLFDLAQEFFQLGGKVLLLDEIHKYPNWSLELKNIYDTFPKNQLVVSGSSSLNIIKGKYDLSRRAVVYPLLGLSLREFLLFEKNIKLAKYSLKQILAEHLEISSLITKKIRILKYFKKYLKTGYYPFYLEGIDNYWQKLNNVLEKVIYEDIPSVFSLKQTSLLTLKKIIHLVASSHPFIPNIQRISSSLGTSKEYIYHYLDYLHKASIFNFVYSSSSGFKKIRKPAKIYLQNSNLIYALAQEEKLSSQIGAIRECFFLNQLNNQHQVIYPKKGDFMVDNQYVFEIGGRQKTSSQIKNLKNSFLVLDDIEIGFKNKIPLYLFGFLY